MDNHLIKTGPVLFGLTALLMLASCGTSSDNEAASVPLDELLSIPDSAIVYEGFGTVRSINPSRTHIVIRHDRIDGFMSAMTMPFPLADTSLASLVEPEDSLRFELSVRGSLVEISDVEVIQ